MHINCLTLRKLVRLGMKHDISILSEQLADLAVPNELRIGLKFYKVPYTLNDMRDNICWGQRLMMGEEQRTDLQSFLHFVCNYFQPFATRQDFSEEAAVKLYTKIAKCHAKDVYPVLRRLVELFNELVNDEEEKLSVKPKPEMTAAEYDRLKPFSNLNILQLVADKCKVKLSEAHLVDYNTVFALLWEAKETEAFRERYNEIMAIKSKAYGKFDRNTN